MSSAGRERVNRWTTLCAGALMLCTLGGCALGVTRVGIKHADLGEPVLQRKGRILVKPFVDCRKEEQRPYVGNKRNGFGMVLGHVAAPEGMVLEQRIAEFFADALIAAGYDAVVENPTTPTDGPYDAVLTGEIRTFWLDLYMAVWHSVDFQTQLHSPDMQRVLWEGDFTGNEKNVLWVGATAEFTKVIREAITEALKKAVEEFASDEFQADVVPTSDPGS